MSEAERFIHAGLACPLKLHVFLISRSALRYVEGQILGGRLFSVRFHLIGDFTSDRAVVLRWGWRGGGDGEVENGMLFFI